MTTEAQDRNKQRAAVLAALKAAGESGATNVQLNGICYRYGARIWELRKEHDIETVKEGRSKFRFVYHEPRQQQMGLFH